MFNNISIKNRISIVSLISLFLVSTGLGLISYFITSSIIENNLENSIVSLSEEGEIGRASCRERV